MVFDKYRFISNSMWLTNVPIEGVVYTWDLTPVKYAIAI